MDQFLAVTKALGDQTRLRVLMALQEDELCLCQVVDLLGLAPSTVSKHLDVLYQAGLVLRRKEGRWHYFRLAGEDADPRAQEGLDWVRTALSQDPAIERDARALKEILKKDVKELCACYSRS